MKAFGVNLDEGYLNATFTITIKAIKSPIQKLGAKPPLASLLQNFFAPSRGKFSGKEWTGIEIDTPFDHSLGFSEP